jgi:hypothetical protein
VEKGLPHGRHLATGLPVLLRSRANTLVSVRQVAERNTGRTTAVIRADRKTVIHPRVGELLLDCETLVGLDHRQRLMVLTPADNETRERPELLQVLGTQESPRKRPRMVTSPTADSTSIHDRRNPPYRKVGPPVR